MKKTTVSGGEAHGYDRDIIIEWIIISLRPLSKTEDQALAGVETAIKMLRGGPLRDAIDSFPRQDSIRRATKKLRKAFGPFDGLQMPVWCGDRPMTISDALDWFDGLEGPSRVDILKGFVATIAEALVNNFSEKPPTATVGGQVSNVATILYQAVTGKGKVKLKHQIDAVRRSWRGVDESKCRGRSPRRS